MQVRLLSLTLFYNGSDHVADFTDPKDVAYLKLSDAYESRQAEPDWELKVTVYNINAGHNKKLMEQCQILAEYAAYVARVRKYAAQMPLKEAVEQAVTECIEEGILAEFLRKNRAEVIKVSIFEYDKEKEEKKLRKAEYEAGWKDGQSVGWDKGWKDGQREGFQNGQREALFHGAKGIIAMGREFQLSDTAIMEQLQNKLHLSETEARNYLKTSSHNIP